MPQQRHPWDPVVLTTLPYFLCAIVAPYPYSILVGSSAIVRAAWHVEHEPMTILFWLEYGLSMYQGFYDIAYLGPTGLMLNTITIGIDFLVNRMATLGFYPYERGHSLWHLLSCILTVYKIDQLNRLAQEL